MFLYWFLKVYSTDEPDILDTLYILVGLAPNMTFIDNKKLLLFHELSFLNKLHLKNERMIQKKLVMNSVFLSKVKQMFHICGC